MLTPQGVGSVMPDLQMGFGLTREFASKIVMDYLQDDVHPSKPIHQVLIGGSISCGGGIQRESLNTQHQQGKGMLKGITRQVVRRGERVF